ncbi:hypothetical protein [Falsihalocynthiibacter sp. CO-5D18]|uniref:hypothetical protein n=1 Tax=Falsihalocynthiibacter sp. CO-5D18 TaxID=3240872 RepID=UPI003510B535
MKLLLPIVLAVIFCAAPAHAGPLPALIGAAFTAIQASTIGAFILKTVASIALSRIAQALRGKPRAPGIKTQHTTTGGVQPQSFILGIYATGGNHIAPPMSHGQHLDYLTYVIDVGDAPSGGVSSIVIDGGAAAFGGTAHADYGLPENGKYAGSLWLKSYDGSQTAADPGLIRNYGGASERPWTADMIGTGIPYVIITARRNNNLFRGEPQIRCIVEGLKLYDPRKDGSMGGVGAHRFDTPSTWEFTQNPQVMIYNILRGITLPDGSIWGVQAEARDLDLATWAARMNVCDVLVRDGDGLDHPQYIAGMEISVDEQPLDVIDEISKSCGGMVAELGGEWVSQVGAVDAPLMSISDEEILRSKPQSLDPYPGLAATFNGVTATFPSPEALWESRDAPARFDAAWEALDGGRRLVAGLNLHNVPAPWQVQRLMKSYIEDERRFRRHTITLGPWALPLAPLSSISWTSARNGYDEKTFEIGSMVINPKSLNVTLELRERDPGDYDWTPSDELGFVDPSPEIEPPSVLAVDGFAALGVTVPYGSQGRERPALQLTWDSVPSIIDNISYIVRVKSNAEIVAQGSFSDIDAGSLYIAEGIIGGIEYEARVRPISNRLTAWSGWVAVTSPDIRLGYVDLAPAIEAEITAAQAQADAVAQGVVTLQGEVTAVQDNLATQIAASDLEFGTVNSELAATGILAQAAVAGGGLITDPFFATFDESEPDDWEKTGDIDPVGTTNEVFPLGKTLTVTTLLGEDGGTYLKHSASGWTGGIDHDGYVVELTFEVAAGDPQSAGMRLSWIELSFKSHYVSLQDANNGVAIEVGRLYTVAFIVVRPTSVGNPVTDMGLYLYGSKDNFGDGLNQPNTTKFHRCAIRPATPEELGGGIINAAITAAVNTETLARVSSEAALANATQTVQSNLDDTNATVSSQATTLAAVDGFAQASAGLTVTTNGGNIAGFIATSFSNPNGSGGSLLELLGSVVKAGTIAANKLSVGFNTNRIVNSNFLDGLTNWFSWGGGTAHSTGSYQVRAAGLSYAGKLYPTFQISCGSAGLDGYQVFENKPVTSAAGMVSFGMPVSAGDWVEASAKLSTHRCRRVIRIRWRDSDNVYLSDSTVEDLSTTGIIGGDSNPADWPKYGGKAQAPADAAYATWQIIKYENLAGTSSYVFVHEPVLCLTTADATELTTYSPDGTTLISGGAIIAETIYASNLNTVDFAATGLSMFGGALKSTNFNGAISGDNITGVGTTGWALAKNGEMILNNLVVRNSIVGGAVSKGEDMLAYINSPAHISSFGSQVGATVSSGAMGSNELWIIALRGEYRHQKSFYGSYNSGNNTTPYSTYRSQLELWQRERSVGGSWGGWYKKTNGVDSSSTTAWSVFEHSYTVMGKGLEMQFKLVFGYAGVDSSAPQSGDQSGSPDVTYTCIRNLGLSAKAVVK